MRSAFANFDSKLSAFSNAQLISQRGGGDYTARSMTLKREQIVLVSRNEPLGIPGFT